MPTIQNANTIAAGAVIDNILQGSQWEFLPYDASLSFGFTADTTNGANARIDVYSGQDVLMENGQCNLRDGFPLTDQDFTLSDIAAAGDRLKVRVRNIGAAGTVTFRNTLVINPL